MWIIIIVVICLIIGTVCSRDYKSPQERQKQQQQMEEKERKLEEMRNKPDEIVEVSLAQLVAHPNAYKYDYTYNKKIVVLTDKMVISSNYTQQKQFRVMRSTGNGKFDYSTTPTIEVSYRNLGSLEKLVMLGDYEKITVQGKVRVDNYGNICIEATNLTWWNWA